MSVRSSTPSIAELRAVGQPPEIFARNSAEHWAGKLYMRKLSPYVTRALLRTSITPDAVTWSMMVAGLAAAAVLTLPGVPAAGGAVLLIQLQLLLDCVDGEMARWLHKRSAVGVYLDQIAHHLTETALLIALGIHADGGWGSLGKWTSLGLLVAVLQLFLKAETALVSVARMRSGLGPIPDSREVAQPRGGFVLRVRRLVGRLPFYRAYVAVESTILIFIAAVVDQIAGDHKGSHVLLIALVAVGAISVVAHLIGILTSQRLQ